ncbi:MAG: AAA family ATPase, partial [Aristaeellaceae bacterium]
MSQKVVIAIGRQFCSGGRYVGRLLAEKLGIPFYDKELLSEAAKTSGICEEILEDHDEKPTRSLLFSLVTGMQNHMSSGSFYMDMPLNHKIFLAQFDAIRRIASEGSCVIVGRCADYVLRDDPDTVSVFVKADMPSKIERAVKYYGIEAEKVEERIRKADKQRASYYNYYATAT